MHPFIIATSAAIKPKLKDGNAYTCHGNIWPSSGMPVISAIIKASLKQRLKVTLRMLIQKDKSMNVLFATKD